VSRALGIDLGTKTLGLALSDEGRTIAQPLETLRRVGPRKDVRAVARLAAERGVSHLVIGDPRNMDGSPGALAEEVRRFAESLRQEAGLPVDLWDERLTTVAAERALLEGGVRGPKRRRVVDQVAAALILQGWLDHRAAQSGRGE
jgi:putative Holliday junction resolvase